MPDHETLAPYPGSAVPHVGTYRRVLPVSLERLYENALDWEHLPFVHGDSFRHIEVLDSGAWGWRAVAVSAGGESMTLELRLDRRCRRWITRTLRGTNQGSEIWTHAFPIGPERVDIVVDFFVPGVAAGAAEKVGKAFAGLYARLYDQDVAMMVERQRQLDIRPADSAGHPARLLLGPRDGLQLPMRIELLGRGYVVTRSGERLVVVPALCPHQLGPLGLSEVKDGTVTCPWHGYRFDVFSGECVSGQSVRLTRLPRIQEEDGQVVVTATH